jgi:lipopolysaccharide biosynthesis regulator YciM
VHRPEPYERRLFVALLRGRLHLAEWKLRHGGFAEARDLYSSILKADPETASFPEVVNPLGEAYLELGRRAPTVEEARVHYRAGLEVPNLDPRLHAELRRRLSAP